MKLYILKGRMARLDRESDRTDIIGVYSSLEKARSAQEVVGFLGLPLFRPSYDHISISEVEMDRMPDGETEVVVWD